MIVTLTPNPSIDATLVIEEPLRSGAVLRASTVTRVAGGKGINVSRAVHLAGHQTQAIFPAADNDELIELVREIDLPATHLPTDQAVRVNTTITAPGGVTTKINGPGPVLSAAATQALVDRLLADAAGACWVVLAGSLPQGMPVDFYSTVIMALRTQEAELNVAVDTSDAPLESLAQNLESVRPTVIKPNGFELGQIAGVDGHELEKQAAAGDFTAIVKAARAINARGVNEVLVTLGGAGAVLTTAAGAWAAIPPPTLVASTVGAGDSALAGYIMARSDGADYPTALAQSVAFGSAAASLPGTGVPSPDLVDCQNTTVFELS